MQRHPVCPHSPLLCIHLFFPTVRPLTQASPPDAWLWTHRNSSCTKITALTNSVAGCAWSFRFPQVPQQVYLHQHSRGTGLVTSSKSARPPSRPFLSHYSHNFIRSPKFLNPHWAQCFASLFELQPLQSLQNIWHVVDVWWRLSKFVCVCVYGMGR